MWSFDANETEYTRRVKTSSGSIYSYVRSGWMRFGHQKHTNSCNNLQTLIGVSMFMVAHSGISYTNHER